MSTEVDYLPRRRSSMARQIREARERDAAAAAGIPWVRNKKSKIPDLVPHGPVTPETAEKEWLAWIASRGWTPFPFQLETWRAFREGRSGLIVLPTGSGKTLAALGGPLMAIREKGTEASSDLRILYISPLKALVRDVEKAVQTSLAELGWRVRVETRTGDTSAGQRRQQRDRLPHVLFTTPESLALLLTQPEWTHRFGGLRAIVIDEWHELLGSKRGSLLELTLAKLRAAVPAARTWAVSATIADPVRAARVATAREDAVLVRAEMPRPVEIHTILPERAGDLPWFGHYGLRRAAEVARELDPRETTMIFTNTRGQAERWHAALCSLRPEWEDLLALHHGSLSREERERIEEGVKSGTLPLVVATTSLELGVDFPLVKKVIQIGSVKGVARATQRAGRAFHRPGERTRLTICPTHFLEYVEVEALRRALGARHLENRVALDQPLDVLVQFVLNSAFPDGFLPVELLREIRAADSFRYVSDEVFAWILNFVTTGGKTLGAYPQFQKVVRGEDGRYRFATPRHARLHRLNIGTIVGDSGVRVKFLRGGTLGMLDEGFLAKLRPGDIFRFAGKTLQLVHVRDLIAYVKIARGKENVATVWGGQSLPLSEALSQPMREILADVRRELPAELSSLSPEIRALAPTFRAQVRRSAIPAEDETLVERIDTREGHHLFVYTWEGRAVNEGMGHLLAFRLSRNSANTIAVSANDHGFECLGTQPFPDDEAIRSALRAGPDLESEIEQSLNFVEMAKRAFREIARVAGLLQVGSPADRKSTRSLQMSSSLLFDVFRQYDPSHPLLQEALREVRRTQLELPRLRAVLQRMEEGRILLERPASLTPFAFPLYVTRIQSRVSTETLADRIERMQKKVFAP